MTPKEYLSQIKRLDVIIEQKIKERDEIARFDISGIDYETDRVQISASSEGPQVRTVEKLIAYEEELALLINGFLDMKKKIIGQIQAVPRLEYMQLLYKRYVEYKRFEVIAAEMNYTYSWVTKSHGRALLMFGNIFCESVNTNANECMVK